MDTADFQMEEEMNVLGEAAAAIHYFSTKRMEHMVIESCEADLAIIINAVANIVILAARLKVGYILQEFIILRKCGTHSLTVNKVI